MKVTGDKLLIRQDDPEHVTKSGIILPDGTEEYPNMGTVIAIGPGVKEKIEEGDRVIFKRKASSAILPYGRPHEEWYGLLVLPEEYILAIVEGD